MRLSLSGFLRPEMKFPSFPDLVKAITNDVDIYPYATFAKTDPFLVNAKPVTNLQEQLSSFWSMPNDVNLNVFGDYKNRKYSCKVQ